MKKATRITLLAAALGSIPALQAAEPAAPKAGDFYLMPGIMLMGKEQARDLDPMLMPSVGLGGQLTDNFALELHVAGGETEVDTLGGDDVDVINVRMDGIYSFGEDAWKPYVVGGISRTRYDYDSSPDDKAFGMSFGAGLRGPITERLGFQMDARGLYERSEDEVTPAITMGLRYTLASKTPAGPSDADSDGVPDSRDQCPETLAGVAVDSRGCALDTDADGVPDYRDQCPDTAPGARVNDKGCAPEPEPEPEPAEPAMMEVHVEFDFDSDALRAGHQRELDKVVDFLEEQPEASVRLEGYTDSRGSSDYNRRLSERRAASVEAYLVDNGVSSERIETAAFGESRPVATNETDSGRQLNRRVVVIAVAAEGAARD